MADVLQAAELAGLFLVLYFVAAAASLPLWVRVSQHIGKLRAWLASMVLAVAVFAWFRISLLMFALFKIGAVPVLVATRFHCCAPHSCATAAFSTSSPSSR